MNAVAIPTILAGSIPAAFTAAGTAIESTSSQSPGSWRAHDSSSFAPVRGQHGVDHAVRVLVHRRPELLAVARRARRALVRERPEVDAYDEAIASLCTRCYR